MSFESDLTAFLQQATGKTVHWDTTPDGALLDADLIVCQQVGGTANWTLDRANTGTKHARVNITAYAKRATARDALALLIENSLRDCSFNVRVVIAPIKGHDQAFGLYSSAQQFEFWYPDS